jgi:hypothetical protein
MSEEHHKDVLKYSIEQFDKSIMFIASGALGISFAFIKDVIPDLKKALRTELLIGSWYIFAGVIFVSSCCHFLSILAHKWAVRKANLEDDEFNNGIKRWNFWIRAVNIVMIIGLFLGTLILINFIKKNING